MKSNANESDGSSQPKNLKSIPEINDSVISIQAKSKTKDNIQSGVVEKSKKA
jgi:hypothetical protein